MSVKNRLPGLVILLVMIVAIIATGPQGVLAQSEDLIQHMNNENKIIVELNDDYFNPEEITIPSGKSTKLQLKNIGQKEHTFTVKKLGIDVELQPGEEKTITLKPENPGTYELICRYHVKEGMVGKVVVNN
ncbi:cupredoxin domain-containing protein [Paucisalibacillus sp. EB02]|uniref:cupredoxin domain-containing protein n=1 Tax=Paucisalibacillus sp. EB02 TaxID=1347087 RepID=UPI0005A85D80|nr:cupredoxin domain-containing protein [Paucisalibacillus sp. EB02]